MEGGALPSSTILLELWHEWEELEDQITRANEIIVRIVNRIRGLSAFGIRAWHRDTHPDGSRGRYRKWTSIPKGP
jgi:hypothetical protein